MTSGYCSKCDLIVGMERERRANWDHYQQWFDAADVGTTKVNGQEHGVESLGEIVENEYDTFEICLYVDVCANCGVPQRAEVYTEFA